VLLAGVALIGVVIFFSIQDKPDRDGEPVASDVVQSQVEPTSTPVSDVSPKKSA
jgi:hypothetical protein